MYKKFLIMIITLSLVFSLPSCTILEIYNDPVYNEEDWIDFNSVQINGIEHLTYQNTTYYNSELKCLWGVGPTPRDTQNFKDVIPLDEKGYIKIANRSVCTGVNGIFAAGDCVDSLYRQACVAAGMGVQAALEAESWLGNNE